MVRCKKGPRDQNYDPGDSQGMHAPGSGTEQLPRPTRNNSAAEGRRNRGATTSPSHRCQGQPKRLA
eukprot:11522286-Alexandrium_andersonii.AAC.1